MVFQKAIERAAPAEEVGLRVNNLIDCITHSVFLYTTRGLFECDKLIFTAQMAFQVEKENFSAFVIGLGLLRTSKIKYFMIDNFLQLVLNFTQFY